MSQPGLSHLDRLRIADENETRELYSMDDDINNNNEIIMMNTEEGSKSPTSKKTKTKTNKKKTTKTKSSEIPSSSSSSVNKTKCKKEKKSENNNNISNTSNVSTTDVTGQQRRLQSSIVKHKRTIGTGDSEAIRSSSRDSDNINNHREEVVDLLFASSNNVDFKLDFNEIFEIESHKKLTQKERDEYWWNDHERNRSMAKNERIVAKHEKQEKKKKKPSSSSSSLKSKNSEAITPSLSSTNKKSSKSYIRGLESWTKVGSNKLDKTISKCVAAVMDEQDRQWEEDDDDELKIAECSINVTKKNAKRARLMGLEDEKEALLLKAQSWMNTDDDASVGSAISIASYGTVAIAKKKKRSEFLSKVDKLNSMKSKNDGEVPVEKKKGTKKKKTKKSSSKSKSKSKNKKEVEEVTTEKGNKSTDDTTVSESTCSTTLPLSTISIFLSEDRMPAKNDNDTYVGESLIESLSRQNKEMHYNNDDNGEQRPEFLIRSNRKETASIDDVGKPPRMFADPPGKTISRKESINCFLQNRGGAPPPPPRHQVKDTKKKTTTTDKKAPRVYDDVNKRECNDVTEIEKIKNNDKKNKLWKKLKTKKSSKTK